MRRPLILLVIGTVLAVSTAVSTTGARGATNVIETTGSVAHTWTNYSNAGGTQGPSIASNASVTIACKVTGFRVADGNTWWYKIASAPWSGAYYVSADAFYNNGSTSGSLHGTPFVDPNVSDCGTAAPAPSRTVTLSQGPAAPAGYRYAISLAGFAANTSVGIECYDSVSPNGFYSFSLTTNSSGSASTASYCYSGDGPDHWVVAGGVQSNHVTWGGGGGGQPTQPPAPGPATAHLSQGPSAPAGYRYAITLSGFSANSSVHIECYDSVSPSGFYAFTLTMNSSGGAFTQSYCYSGDGPDHWVTANGVESNHVAWGSSSSGGGGGTTTNPAPVTARPAGALATPPPTESAPSPKPVNTSFTAFLKYAHVLWAMEGLLNGCKAASWDNCYQLGEHYLDATGTPVTIPMHQLIQQEGPLRAKFQYWLNDNVNKMTTALRATPSNQAAVVCFDTGGGIATGNCPESQFPSSWPQYKPSSPNWVVALHTFSIRMIGDEWIGPADASGNRPVQIRYSSNMFDIYDFDPSDPVYGQFAGLAQLGWAAPFLETGSTGTVTVSTNLNAIASGLVLQY